MPGFDKPMFTVALIVDDDTLGMALRAMRDLATELGCLLDYHEPEGPDPLYGPDGRVRGSLGRVGYCLACVSDEPRITVRVVGGCEFTTRATAQADADVWVDVAWECHEMREHKEYDYDVARSRLADAVAYVVLMARMRIAEPWASTMQCMQAASALRKADAGGRNWVDYASERDEETATNWVPIWNPGETLTLARMSEPFVSDRIERCDSTVATSDGRVVSMMSAPDGGWLVSTGHVIADGRGTPIGVVPDQDRKRFLPGCVTPAGVLAHVLGPGQDTEVTLVAMGFYDMAALVRDYSRETVAHGLVALLRAHGPRWDWQ